MILHFLSQVYEWSCLPEAGDCTMLKVVVYVLYILYNVGSHGLNYIRCEMSVQKVT
jgi:hypothetical protein